MKVRKVVIPIAGLGTRFLPVSKSVPKVLLPVYDTSPVHYAVMEAAAAGIEQVIFVVSREEALVSDYFDKNPDLEHVLQLRGENMLLERVREIPSSMEFRYVKQEKQLGLGHAVLMARQAVGHEPFAVILPDDLIYSETPTIGRMIEIFDLTGSPVIAIKEVPDELVSSLGIVEPGWIDKDIYEVKDLVEKPDIGDKPSNLAIIGRYILPPRVFGELEKTNPGSLGEIQLTDSLANLRNTLKIYGYRFPGSHFDVGTPMGLLKASVHTVLQEDEAAVNFKTWLFDIIK